MLRLVKYLKPFTLLILFAIVLLFIQAMADLSLPDYMGQIVNNGIQADGIENAVPRAVRQSEMKKLVLFLGTTEQTLVTDAYVLVDKDSPDYAQDVKTYPALANEPVYVLKQVDSAAIDKLNPILGRAFTAVYGIEQMMADPSKSAMVQRAGIDLSKFAQGGNVFALLGLFPASTRAQMLDGMNKTFDAMGESMVIQSAAGAIKAEYTALGMDIGSLQSSYMLRIGILMLLVTLVSVTCTILVGFLSARTAAGMARDIRRDLFQRVENFSSTEFDRFSTASLITRSTNDITQIQMVVIMMMRMVIYAPIMGVGGIIRAMSKDVSMWWIIALAVVILLGLIITVFSVSLPKFKIMQSLIDRLNLVTRENLSGMMVIRAFNMQKFEEKRFDQANRNLTNTSLFVSRVMVVMFPMMTLIMSGLSLLIIWVGAHQVAELNMQVGDMMAFLQYAMQIVMSFLMMSIMFIILPRASVSGGRIADVLETEPVIKDPAAPKTFQPSFQGTIEFQNVSFRYPGAEDDVLHDLSFAAQPGQTTAFIGSTGSGKSTLVNLIPRFYDVTGGSILVDGTDIRQVTQHDLRDKIGYVPQKSTLFSGTIESNLRYADEAASEDTLKSATDIAQATEFITSKPEGITAEIGQGGMNVSGGQKQRLSIARALVKQPPIYIFDDSFSALDFKTDAALRRALREHAGSSTLLIVTQRVSTIKNAEQIIVLDEGRIVGKGTHRELMNDCETYREIALSQLSQEELA